MGYVRGGEIKGGGDIANIMFLCKRDNFEVLILLRSTRHFYTGKIHQCIVRGIARGVRLNPLIICFRVGVGAGAVPGP